MKTFGQILKNCREEKGLTQQELACILNLSKQVICNYENDRRKPDIYMLRKIASFFEISTDILLNQINYIKNTQLDLDTLRDFAESYGYKLVEEKRYHDLEYLEFTFSRKLDGIIKYRDVIYKFINCNEFLEFIRYLGYFIKSINVEMVIQNSNVTIKPIVKKSRRFELASSESNSILIRAINELLIKMCYKVRKDTAKYQIYNEFMKELLNSSNSINDDNT